MLNSTRKFIIVGVGLSAAHLILTILSIVMSLVLSSPRFDNPAIPVSTFEKVTNFLAPILIQPMWYIVHSILHLTPKGTILEWSLFLLNSSLWGFCIALLFSYPRYGREL